MADINIEAAIWDREDGLTFGIAADGEHIGEMVIYEDEKVSHIDWVSKGERINNGCLAPAQLAVARCYLLDRLEKGSSPLKVRDLYDEVVLNTHNYAKLLANREPYPH